MRPKMGCAGRFSRSFDGKSQRTSQNWRGSDRPTARFPSTALFGAITEELLNSKADRPQRDYGSETARGIQALEFENPEPLDILKTLDSGERCSSASERTTEESRLRVDVALEAWARSTFLSLYDSRMLPYVAICQNV